MGKMKEIYTGVIEIIEDIDNRFLKDKSAAYKLVFIEGLINRLEKRKVDIMNKWGKENDYYD